MISMTSKKEMRQSNHWGPAATATDCTGRSVHIWKLSLLQNSEGISNDILSTDEIHKAERFYFDSDRNKFVLTRTMLRNLLSRYTGVDAKELTFSYNKHGKPYLLNPSKNESIFFNVTHSKDVALFAFTRLCEIGIDIEYIRDDTECLKLAKRFFSEQEYQALAQLSGNDLTMGFYRCWTLKEAFVKALGSGFSFPLNTFTVNFEKDDCPQLTWVDKRRFQGTCKMFSILHDEHYFASLACLKDPAEINYYHCAEDAVV
ncbi:MAG: 4'-phosphopantetheinyl transferase superfamily protein [Desulfocapsaceae bacterium]|nr:4'-phosphopantetheinyl transferase superfamily protein [Desulfocapsaceae bacterium]